MSRTSGPVEFMESAYSPRVTRVFAIVVRRMFRGNFASVRAAKGSLEVIRALDVVDGPALIALNHSSWWDPLVCVLLGTRETPLRTHAAPMDVEQLRRFRFMRKIGIFGVAPDDPRSLPRMRGHVLERFARERACTVWITPQGEFRDVREEIVLRPGVGALAARVGEAPMIALAIEYAFWQDKRPEVFWRAQRVDPPDDRASARAWTEAFECTMRANRSALAALVIARESSAFEGALRGKSGANHPVYDLWLRVRGKHGGIESDRNPTAPTTERAS